MGKDAYIGINGIAKKIKAMYVGVNGVAKKAKKAHIGVNGVAKEWWNGGEHGYLFVGSNVYHTNDFNTFTQGTRISNINANDIHHIAYSETRHRWEVQMKTTSANLPSGMGTTDMYRVCYYNTDSKAQGQWAVENIYPDGVTGPWDISASYSDSNIYLNVSTYDFEGFYISKTIDVGKRIWGLSVDHIDYINIGEDLLISLGMTYEYHYQADPYYGTVTVWINCSTDTSKRFLQDGLWNCDLYALNGYEDPYYEVKFTAVTRDKGEHGYESFIAILDYDSRYRTDYMGYGTWRNYFSDGIDIYYCDGSNTYKVTDLTVPPSNWQFTLVDSGHGFAGY